MDVVHDLCVVPVDASKISPQFKQTKLNIHRQFTLKLKNRFRTAIVPQTGILPLWSFSIRTSNTKVKLFIPIRKKYNGTRNYHPLSLWWQQWRQSMSSNLLLHPNSHFHTDFTKVEPRGTGLSKSLYCYKNSWLDGNLPVPWDSPQFTPPWGGIVRGWVPIDVEALEGRVNEWNSRMPWKADWTSWESIGR